ncbi:MAG: peptidoglycan D,D-transpeptidase FtsI family protein [Candidatus Bipolaricaulia bacterium]
MRWKVLSIATLVILASGVVLGRLVYLQVFQHELWSSRAEAIQTQVIRVPANRGRLFDRNGILLADNLRTIDIAVDPSYLTEPELLKPILSQELGLDAAYLNAQLSREGRFAWIRRQVPLAMADRIRRRAEISGIRGLIFLDSTKRIYPQGQLAANVIGFAGVDNQGLEGIEFGLDELLDGEDRVARLVSYTSEIAEVIETGRPGHDVYLTLDSQIQHIAESEVDRGVNEFLARHGFAVVMNVNTGEILAMAQDARPDPNDFQSTSPDQWRNRAISYMFEPGSSLKIFAGLAALENGAIELDEQVSGDEPVVIAGHAFHNAENINYGMVTLRDIIQLSINTGMIRVAQQLGPEPLYAFLKQLRFGERTGLNGLSGEAAGMLRPVENWSELAIGAVPIGQSIAVTGLQLITRAAAIAKDGLLLKPQLVLRVEDREGNLVQRARPEVLERVISEENARIMKQIMRQAVMDGTGRWAEVEGFEVAGKTGTAQKASPEGGYAEGKFTSLFVGFFPASHPQLAILVVLDEVQVKPFWGGQTAGVIFQRMARRIVERKRIPPVVVADVEPVQPEPLLFAPLLP